MFFRVILFIWDFVLGVIAVRGMTDDEKDVEILLLRQQLRIVERKQERGPQIRAGRRCRWWPWSCD